MFGKGVAINIYYMACLMVL